MSFDLGDWASQLSCDICSDDPMFDDLDLSADYLDGDLPGGFWDEAAEPTEDFEFDLPDYYPTLEFLSGGFMIGIHGAF